MLSAFLGLISQHDLSSIQILCRSHYPLQLLGLGFSNCKKNELLMFKSSSTDAALVLVNIVPLQLKVVEIVTKRLISSHAALLPPSSRHIAGDIPERILIYCKPVDISLRLHRETLLKSEIQNLWNLIWSTAATGAQTRLFFPSVEPLPF